MWAHIQAVSRKELHRSHPIEEDERTHHLPLLVAWQAAATSSVVRSVVIGYPKAELVTRLRR
jgi:hypothetical protein